MGKSLSWFRRAGVPSWHPCLSEYLFFAGKNSPSLASKGLHHVNHPISSFSSHIPSASSSTPYGKDLIICFFQTSWQDGVHRPFSAKQSWSYEILEITFELKDLLDRRDVVQDMLTSRDLGTEMFQTPAPLYTPKSAVRLKQETVPYHFVAPLGYSKISKLSLKNISDTKTMMWNVIHQLRSDHGNSELRFCRSFLGSTA